MNEASLPTPATRGKICPSRAPAGVRGTPAGGRDDRAAPPGCVDGALERCAGTARSPPGDTRGRSRRALGRTADKSKMAGCIAGNFASEAASPRAPQPETRFIPLDSREDRRHTPRVEHVSTCQTPRARSLYLRALTCSGPSQRRATLPQATPAPRDAGDPSSFLRFYVTSDSVGGGAEKNRFATRSASLLRAARRSVEMPRSTSTVVVARKEASDARRARCCRCGRPGRWVRWEAWWSGRGVGTRRE